MGRKERGERPRNVTVTLGVNPSDEKMPALRESWRKHISPKRKSRCKVTEVGMILACLGDRKKAIRAEQTRVITDEVAEGRGGL